MENIKVAPSEDLREFIEKRLAFGAPMKGATLELLFTENPNTFHYVNAYGDNITGSASINAVNQMQWDSMHALEEGVVLHELYSKPKERVLQFLQQHMASKGFSISNVLHERQSENLMVIAEIIEKFEKDYRTEVNPELRVVSSMTLRKAPESMNWDLHIRAAFFTEEESGYVHFVFRQIVPSMNWLLTDEQASDSSQAVRDFFASFEEPAAVFDDLPVIALSRLMVHMVLHKRDINPESLWSAYYDKVKHNAAVIRDAEKLKPWNQLTKVQVDILHSAMEVVRIYLHTHLTTNAALAASK